VILKGHNYDYFMGTYDVEDLVNLVELDNDFTFQILSV
jgi:hypothetical protein